MTLRDQSDTEHVECSIEGCLVPARTRGYCRRHHDRFRKSGNWPLRQCSECGTQLLEPADRCGFCIVEGSPELLSAWNAGAVLEKAAA
jgi:hypothetical protein